MTTPRIIATEAKRLLAEILEEGVVALCIVYERPDGTTDHDAVPGLLCVETGLLLRAAAADTAQVQRSAESKRG